MAAQPPKGGPVISGYSLAFVSGARSAIIPEQDYYVLFGPSGTGPVEPSLASVSGTSLIKNYSPLTTASSNNTRSGMLEYTVRSGDIPSIIAASFGITTNTLLWANNLSEGQYIRPGDKLIIPPASGVRYKVKSGDTVSSIAMRLKGDIQEIISFNGLSYSGSITEGEYIFIPDGEMPVTSYVGRYSAAFSAYSGKNLDGYFIHPTAGVGYISQGLHPYNAVDIAGPCWTPIYAAAAGAVSIADGYGWNGGYGGYIKITHQNGTQTLYSHTIQNKVSAGQEVSQGQLIGYTGSTGRSTGCHVHWEVYGALNPLR